MGRRKLGWVAPAAAASGRGVGPVQTTPPTRSSPWRGRPTTNHHLRLDQFKPLHQLDLLHGGGVQQLIIISGGVQQGEPWRRRPTNKQQPTIIIYGRCLCSEGQRNQTSWQVGKTRGFGSTRRSSEMSEEKRIV